MVYLDNGSTSFPKPEYVLKKHSRQFQKIMEVV